MKGNKNSVSVKAWLCKYEPAVWTACFVVLMGSVPILSSVGASDLTAGLVFVCIVACVFQFAFSMVRKAGVSVPGELYY